MTGYEAEKEETACLIRFADSGRRTQATKLEGVRRGIDGGCSVVGVAVPESGYAGEGAVEAVEREERMPDNMAIPSVPGSFCQTSHSSNMQAVRTASEDREGHRLRAISVIERAVGHAEDRRHIRRIFKSGSHRKASLFSFLNF